MRWMLYILIFLALLVLAGFLFPREATTERSVYISEPPEVVFPYLNNFRNFNKWSPWFELDPDTEYVYEGVPEGNGATMRWRSNNPKVGNGSQTITASEPYSLVATTLDFGGQGTASANFKLVPQGQGTNVTWSFSSEMGAGPIARWMGVMVSRMVGQSYEDGLQKLKTVVEQEATETSGSSTPSPEAGTEDGSPDVIEPEDVDPGMENPIIDDEDPEGMSDDDGDAIEEFQPEDTP
ncbi:SRPBCC family protein [Microbulbifer aggregans]|uniref:SRPBCC family protein n=1 Tax=Microbulbifer aggregans TaxID=1769779 RepID=UPI001CFD42BC|nr:SRPBCC family protein [Microbulbifer aggregans]